MSGTFLEDWMWIRGENIAEVAFLWYASLCRRVLLIEIKQNTPILERRYLIKDTPRYGERRKTLMYRTTRDCLNLSHSDVHQETLYKRSSSFLRSEKRTSSPHFDLLPEEKRQILWTHRQAGGVASLRLSAMPLQLTRTPPPKVIHLHVTM